MAEAAAAPFEARYSVSKLLGWALLASPLLAGSVWILSGSVAQGSVIGTVIGAFGLAFFGGVTAGFLRCLIDRRVQLRIDAKGLYLRPHSATIIPLRSIRSFQLGSGIIRLFLHKPSKYPLTGAFRRFLYRVNGAGARPYFGDAWIWLWHYDCNACQVVDALDLHTVPTAFERDLAARMRAGHE